MVSDFSRDKQSGCLGADLNTAGGQTACSEAFFFFFFFQTKSLCTTGLKCKAPRPLDENVQSVGESQRQGHDLGGEFT